MSRFVEIFSPVKCVIFHIVLASIASSQALSLLFSISIFKAAIMFAILRCTMCSKRPLLSPALALRGGLLYH